MQAAHWRANCTVLATQLTRIAGSRRTCDFTFNSLRRRSGRDRGQLSRLPHLYRRLRDAAEDVRYVDWAVGVGEEAQPGRGHQHFRFRA